ncbi:hypothetical protein [Actinacidiphila acidipaludis]|uniref:Uncharacterized protein n=1 Tax=Actinacidiphila acidipaludis TaxID=2873382 RepID=A0ABS7QGY5_9ACTN|nr:hypothetical protein [Streptomyces acidipaludis]MBY8882418.1 hypothetical protein [Streptomyces acidipaludis]
MAGVSELVRAELDRHPWETLRCGCGDSAGHVPMMFEVVIEAESARDMIGYTLDGHLELGTNLFAVSVPAVSVILAALAGELSPPARAEFLETLGRMVSGESHFTQAALGRTHLGDECRARCREGLWVVGRIGLTGSAVEAETAADIFEFVDLDEARSAFYQARLRRRRAAKTKRRRSL